MKKSRAPIASAILNTFYIYMHFAFFYSCVCELYVSEEFAPSFNKIFYERKEWNIKFYTEKYSIFFFAFAYVVGAMRFIFVFFFLALFLRSNLENRALHTTYQYHCFSAFSVLYFIRFLCVFVCVCWMEVKNTQSHSMHQIIPCLEIMFLRWNIHTHTHTHTHIAK